MPIEGVIELRGLAVKTAAVPLSDDIRRARELAGLTQPQLAEMIGVSESTISNWERGRTPRNALARVRNVLNLDTTLPAEPPDLETDEERILREVADGPFWAEATRRFFRNAITERAQHSGAQPVRGGTVDPPKPTNSAPDTRRQQS
ncbi:MAG: helix-turn-helix domain-containing protein [Trebonia sp.]